MALWRETQLLISRINLFYRDLKIWSKLKFRNKMHFIRGCSTHEWSIMWEWKMEREGNFNKAIRNCHGLASNKTIKRFSWKFRKMILSNNLRFDTIWMGQDSNCFKKYIMYLARNIILYYIWCTTIQKIEQNSRWRILIFD